jgi:hypothetical protein
MTQKQTARARRKSAPGTAPVKSGPSGEPPVSKLDAEFPHRPHGMTAVPVEQDSDWVRLPPPRGMVCGLRRSYLFALCKAGKIRSVTIRQPHNTRGVRLIYKPSILAMLASLDLAQNGAREGGQQ